MTDDELLLEMLSRTRRGNMLYYMPFNETNSARLRAIHRGSTPAVYHAPLYTKSGILIATDYERIVIGDYGAFIEFTAAQANLKIFERWFKMPPAQSMKYDWYFPQGDPKTKIYFQLKTVPYADYRIGYYYVSPHDIKQSLGDK